MAETAPLFIANWKMQLDRTGTTQLITACRQAVHEYAGPVELVICPSFPFLADAQQLLQGSKIKLGAQDVFWHDRGAYTGAVSPGQLKELGVSYAIIGHSERRQHLGETDAMVARKMVSALGHGLQPVLCVGETAAARSRGQQETTVRRQLTEAFRCTPPPAQGHRIAVAYEPIWAIGTGSPADPNQAIEMLAMIKQTLVDIFNADLVERQFVVLYGGSVDPDNITNYVKPDGFHGVLAGTSSLQAESFATMVKQLTK